MAHLPVVFPFSFKPYLSRLLAQAGFWREQWNPNDSRVQERVDT
jgi:hypothetical protein